MKNITKNINLIEFEYNNVSNKLKNISKLKFMEHVIDTNNNEENINNEIQLKNSEKDKEKSNKISIVTKEEKEIFMVNKFKTAINRSYEAFLNNKAKDESSNSNFNNKDSNEILSVIEDDMMSIASSKILSVNKSSFKIKLPLVYGTIEYNSNKYIGMIDEGNNNKKALTSLEENKDDKEDNASILSRNLKEKNDNNYNKNDMFNPNNNYSYNPLAPRESSVSEFQRPDFNKLMESDMNYMKKQSLEFNLNNFNNQVNYTKSSNAQENLLMNSFSTQNQNLNLNLNLPKIPDPPKISNSTQKIKNIKIEKTSGKGVPKAPPLSLPQPPTIPGPGNSNKNMNVVPPSFKQPEIPTLNNSNNSNNSNNLMADIHTQIRNMKNNLNKSDIDNNYANNTNTSYDNDGNNNYNYHQNNGRRETLDTYNNLNPTGDHIESKPVNFKDTLNNKFNRGMLVGNMKAPNNSFKIEKNENIADRYNEASLENNNNNINQNIQKNGSPLESNKITLDKNKSITLNNFIRKKSLFDVEEDDEEDNTGLFKSNNKQPINLMIMKKNTSNLIDKETLSNIEKEKEKDRENIFNKDINNNNLNNINRRQTTFNKSIFKDHEFDDDENEKNINTNGKNFGLSSGAGAKNTNYNMNKRNTVVSKGLNLQSKKFI